MLPVFYLEVYQVIKITMTNSKVVKWLKGEFDDYMYDGKFFIVIRNGEWIGFYNLEHVISIIIKEE